MGKLTNIRHEKFIQNIVKGMSQRQAYKDVYKNKMTDKQIDEEACKLFNSPKINQRYEELLQELEDKSIMSAKERMKWLTDVISGNIKEVNLREALLSDKMKAIDILNKMSGEYTTKLEGNIGVTNIRVDIDE